MLPIKSDFTVPGSKHSLQFFRRSAVFIFLLRVEKMDTTFMSVVKKKLQLQQ